MAAQSLGGLDRRGYPLKGARPQQAWLIEATEKVASVGSVIDPLMVDALIQARVQAGHCRLVELTPREREVLAETGAREINGGV